MINNNQSSIFLVILIPLIISVFLFNNTAKQVEVSDTTGLNMISMHYDSDNLQSKNETKVQKESSTQIKDEIPENSQVSSKPSLLKEYYSDEMWKSGSITINKMLDFNGKTKQEILNIRKYYVKKSIFNTNNYEPSEQVFGQIIDNKPWMNETSSCTGKRNGNNIIKGLSEESLYVNNPILLIGIEHPYFDNKTIEQCKDVDKFIPEKINYSKDKNIIRVVYNISSYKGGIFDLSGQYGFKLVLKGLNAVDLGYKYASVDRTKNIKFNQQPNIRQNIYEFKDFIHLGSACGVDGGCNNGSPYQPETDFNIKDYPSCIHIKLWKNLPKDISAEPDITYVLLFR